MSLFQSGHLTKRNFASLEEFRSLLAAESEIVLDVTEVGVQRAKGYEEQKKDYSGKKKHTRKSLILTSRGGGRRKIYYMSKLHRGKEHDYSILKQEFPSDRAWFLDKTVLLDLGFQGFDDLYEAEEVWLPHKRKRVKKGLDNSLSEQQKQGKIRPRRRLALGWSTVLEASNVLELFTIKSE